MNNEREIKHVFEAQPEGRRRCRRPRNEWKQYIAGTELKTITKMTLEMDKWPNSERQQGKVKK